MLQRFSEGDEAAFAALVNRHTGMVLGVCRRVLSTIQDAEDACQATFLVLARKAKTGRWQPSIANWLYTTARRVASKANRATARRRKREARIAPPAPVSALDQMTGREAFAALDEELSKLAPIYCESLVLCYLEGLTRDEAAVRLGIPAATLKSQLERGRKKLADALTKRGIVVGSGLLAVAATSSARASSPRLVESILATIGSSPSSSVAALAVEVTVNGFVANAKWLLLATITLTVIGFGLASMPIAARPQKPVQLNAKPETNQATKPKPAEDERIIRGKVLGADGKPIEAELSLVWIAAKPQALGKTKADGTFQVTVPLAHNEEGGWLVARALGHGPDFYPTGISYSPESMTRTSNLTLKLPKEQQIRGRILDTQGKPVTGGLVLVTCISTFDSEASTRTHLTNWATTTNQQGGSPPEGDRDLWFSEHIGDSGENRSPYRTTTDQDGRFEMAGIGAGQMVQLSIKGKGMGNKEIVILNNPGFDPNPINKLARDSEIKGFPIANKWHLHVLDPVIVMEKEKIIRGTVTDHEGKPRAGVRVLFFRSNLREINPGRNSAITDKDGHYQTQGALKNQQYKVEVGPDTEAGLLQCAAEADDTPGYEPITLNLKCARGVVIQGTIRNKATNQPIRAQMHVNALADNPFVKNDPNLLNAVFLMNEKFQTDNNRRFRVVTIPGPVLGDLKLATPNEGEGD